MAACILDTCDLFVPACPAAAGCYPTFYGNVCWLAGLGTTGSACTDFRDCAAGRTCIFDGSNDICFEMCDLLNPACSSGTACSPTSNPDYGVCLIAAALLPCTGTPGSGLPDDPDLCTKTITVASTQNVITQTFIFPYTLEVLPTSQISANQPFNADISGAVELTEYFVDWLQIVIPGGATDIKIVDLLATVQTRGGGATGADVALGWDSSSFPFKCDLSGTVCDPANDDPPNGNTDCFPTGSFNPCVQKVDFPFSTDCVSGGVCDILGKLGQCSSNGFCATGSVLLPLIPVVGASYMAGDGVTPGQTEALFGWADDPPPATAVGVPAIDPNGTWNMISTTYTGIAGELGIAFNAGGLFLAFEGVMGVDSNGPDGVGVPNDGSPTPDSALLSFPVQVP
jgi:hypothetical protein